MGIGKGGALQGIRVLDLSRMLPGPFCSMILADHGAEVIAVEYQKLCDEELFFGDLYRNKHHISLNLKSSKGREIFYRLAENVDVIIEGFRPGVAKRLGVDYETLQHLNPAHIYCSITGYGQSGPNRDLAGHDVNYLAKTGLLSLNGPMGQVPVIPGIQIGDIAGGAMQAVTGILLALFHREKTGAGQYIDISMTDGLLGFLHPVLVQARKEERWPEGSKGRFSHRFACYSTYETRDGRYLAVGSLEPKFWESLCQALDRPEFVSLQYMEDAQEHLKAELAKIFRSRSAEQWEQVFRRLDNCCCTISSLAEVLKDGHFRARDMVLQPNGTSMQPGDTTESGEMEKTIGIPIKLSRTPGSIRRKAPTCGADTVKVLLEYGYSRDEIDRFASEGVV